MSNEEIAKEAASAVMRCSLHAKAYQIILDAINRALEERDKAHQEWIEKMNQESQRAALEQP